MPPEFSPASRRKGSRIRGWAQWTLIFFGSTAILGGGYNSYLISHPTTQIIQVAGTHPDVALEQFNLLQKQAERQLVSGGSMIAVAGGLRRKRGENEEEEA